MTFSKPVILLLLLLVNVGRSQNFPRASGGMVVSAESLATKVGVEILKKGGNAIDAAVAVGFALAVTYPVAGNLGGGGFMVLHLKEGKDISIDYREKAPGSATRDMYLDENGKVSEDKIKRGESSAGVPGSVAGMLYALEKYGTLKRQEVLEPAIRLAGEGFLMPQTLAKSIKSHAKELTAFPSSKKVFTKNGVLYQKGELFIQPDLAKTLRRISTEGRNGFYKGEVANCIAEQCKQGNGFISLNDLSLYEPRERAVIKGTYRGYDVISMPPPSSGGVILIEMLNILENFDFTEKDRSTGRYQHILVETMKRAYADRAEYLGDPDFVKIPIEHLISKIYAKNLASKIGEHATESKEISARSNRTPNESKETTHYSVVDSCGNAVSVTTTINSGYGAKVVVEGAGFLLNNEMDDFSAKPGVPNQFGLIGGTANAIEGNKRMLSSMTPTIVLKDGKPIVVLGSPGGSTIITTVLQVISNIIDFNMSLREALDAPRLHHQLLPDFIEFENGAMSHTVSADLIKRGHIFGSKHSLGLVEAVFIDSNNSFWGATDSRGSGLAEGF